MRILVYGDLGGSGGYHRYCKGLFGSSAIPPDIEVWFVCSTEFYKQLGTLDPSVQLITHPWLSSPSRTLRYLWFLWVYPRLVRQVRPDVEFYPSGHRRVYMRSALTVTTCHNLLLFDTREINRLHDKADYYAFMRYRMTQADSFRKSDATIFTSDFSRSIITQQIPEISKSTVIANGLDADFLRIDARSYELGSTITLLYVSPVYHYKHQVEVVQAIKCLRTQTGRDLRLRLIGGGDPSAIKALMHLVEIEEADSYVHMKPFVAHAELLAEYRSADIFIFASSCEAFGISLLEAMGSRLPIACSNEAGLSDILQGAGIYFDPGDVDSIAQALQRLLEDDHFRKRCGEEAYLRAKEYTWERCAQETLDFLKSVGGN